MDDLTGDSPTLTPAAASAGRLLAGRYEFRALLGRGAWKEVYLAYDERLDREVAFALVTGAGGGKAAQARVRREAQVTGRLGDHPNIVTVYDSGEVDGIPFFVLRAMTGGSLADAPRRAAPEVIRLGAQIARALAHAHAHGVVHRDVKPDNVWLDARGSAALGDFGIAYEIDDARLTAAEAVIGTARYLSPEQARGETVGPASDLYSLGVTLYELLTGRPPFTGPTESILAQHLTALPAPLSQHEPAIEPALERLVLELLEKRPGDRPASAAVVAERLAVLLAAPANALVPPDVAAPLTSLVGREHDLDAIAAALRRPEVRLLTLTGTGGIGKTRLALELERAMRGEFRDGGYVVSLASIADADLVLGMLVQRLGHVPLAGETPLTAAQRLLACRELLLVLDNFEHVLAAAVGVAELLAACPGVVALVTSREPLRVSGEHVYDVPALSLPTLSDRPGVATLESSAAVDLFAERAAAADPAFALTRANRHTIGRICAKLDGLPLAIELAAARVAFLGPQELLARLERSLSVLTDGVRDAHPRHRTLRATIDWSHELLAADEQAALRALAVFAGGATLAAAEDVTGASLATIESLVAKSLVARRAASDDAPRLLLLETIREYALERLDAGLAAAAVRRRHCEHYVELAERAAQELWGPRQMSWMRALDEEADNLRAAVDWSLRTGEPQLGLRIAAAVMEQWGQRRAPGEVAGWIAATLDAASPVDPGLRARALLGRALGVTSDSQAAGFMREALPYAREADDARTICWCLQGMALAARAGQDEAIELAAEAVRVARAAGDPASLSIALETTICVSASLDESIACFGEAMALLDDMGDELVTAALQHNLGCQAIEHGDERLAREGFDAAIASGRRTGDRSHLPYALAMRGLLALLQDDVAMALETLRETLQRCRVEGFRPPVWEALVGLAATAARQGNADRAALLSGASAAVREDEPYSAPERRLFERHLEPLRAADRTSWDAGRRRGAALSFHDAIAAGLDEPDEEPDAARAAARRSFA
jgi:non-specific serine/threonine protein kinase